jgi:hypothetical protein
MIRIPVALFPNRGAAEPVRAHLAELGIIAEIHDETGLGRFWFVSKKEAGVRLEVPAEQFKKSEQLLVDWDRQAGALHEAIHCPECKSLLVEYPQVTHKSISTNVAMGVAAELGLIDREYYCQSCQFTWPKEGAPPKTARSHMAPFYFIEGAEPLGPK